MAETHKTDTELELHFEAGRETAPLPSHTLLARIMADAEAELSTSAPGAMPPRQAVRRGGWLAGLAAAVGGWGALAGLGTATVAGVWIGYAAPGEVGTLMAEFWPGAETGYDVGDLIPSMDIYLAEGGA